MKKYMTLIIICILFIPTLVYGECSDEDMVKYSSLAGQIKASYTTDIEEFENIKVLGTPNSNAKYRVINISINNISPNLSVKVNDDLGAVGLYNYEDTTDGNVIIKNYDVDKINTYEINVFVNDNESSCNLTKIKTLYLSTPKYNSYSNYTICKGLEEKIVYCNSYVSNDFSEDTFFKKVNKYMEDNNISPNKTIEDNNNGFNYTWLIVIVLIILFIFIFVGNKVKKHAKKK